jgi:hypothetical protein
MDDDKSTASKRSRKDRLDDAKSSATRKTNKAPAAEGSPVAKLGIGATDMERYEDFRQRLDIAAMLDGAALGDHLYAARRFKPTVPGAAMKMNKLLAKAGVAEQLASDRVGKLKPDKRTELFGQLGSTTPCSLKYSQDIIQLHVDEAEPLDVLPTIVPWRTMDMGGADVFDLNKPLVALLSCGPQMKAQTFETMLCEHIVVDLISGGKNKMAQLSGFVDACSEAVAESSRLTGLPAEFVKSRDHLEIMCAVLRLAPDPSPISVAKSTVDIRLVRKMAMGIDVPPPWELISEALESNDVWKEYKSELRRALTDDMTIGCEMIALQEKMDKGDSEALSSALEKLPSWVARCRKGGAISVQDSMMKHLEQQVHTLEKSIESADKLGLAKMLDAQLTRANAVGFTATDALRTAMRDLQKRARAICEESSRAVIEIELLKTLQEMPKEPTKDQLFKLTEAFDNSQGVKFADEVHVELIRSGVAGLVIVVANPQLSVSMKAHRVAEIPLLGL